MISDKKQWNYKYHLCPIIVGYIIGFLCQLKIILEQYPDFFSIVENTQELDNEGDFLFPGSK